MTFNNKLTLWDSDALHDPVLLDILRRLSTGVEDSTKLIEEGLTNGYTMDQLGVLTDVAGDNNGL